MRVSQSFTKTLKQSGVVKATNALYHQLQDTKIEVLYNDRDIRPGEQFANTELMGMLYRRAINEKPMAGVEALKSLTKTTNPQTT